MEDDKGDNSHNIGSEDSGSPKQKWEDLTKEERAAWPQRLVGFMRDLTKREGAPPSKGTQDDLDFE